MDALRAVTLFVSTAEMGSFNRTAISHGMSAQAVSKTIQQLERHLGFRLFHRTTRKNALTEDGQRFLEAVRPNLEGLTAALSVARQDAQDQGGLIRISATRTIGILVLLPLIAAFRELHPNIEFELVLEERFTDLVENRIDIGFRSGTSPEAQVISRRLFPLLLIPCASPAYLEKYGMPNSMQELQTKHVCTGYRQATTGKLMPWEFEVEGETCFASIPAVFCTNDSGAEMEAVLAGHGAGLLDGLLAAPYLRSGALVPFMVDQISARMGTYIYYPQRSNMPRRVRNFIDFALERLFNNPLYTPSTEELRRLQRQHTQTGTNPHTAKAPRKSATSKSKRTKQPIDTLVNEKH